MYKVECVIWEIRIMRSGLTELEGALALARLKSFRAAASALGVSTSSLSQTIAALETRIGVRLFNRTTRSVALSEAGEQFVATIAPALASIRDAMEQAGSHRDVPAGTLRLNCSIGAARQLFDPLLLEYLRRYPQMALDVVTEGRLVDIVVDGFDAGIRLAGSVPQDMISVPLGASQRFTVVATPEYFAEHGIPRSPVDLAAHRCIRARHASGAIFRWWFERHGEVVELDVQGPLTLDHASLKLAAARAGLGLAYLVEWEVEADLASGRLQRVLQDWTPAFDGLCLYYPGRRHLPAGLRALIELIRERRPSADGA
jgi:DNA-binding transcriptional LysR family regulator